MKKVFAGLRLAAAVTSLIPGVGSIAAIMAQSFGLMAELTDNSMATLQTNIQNQITDIYQCIDSKFTYGKLDQVNEDIAFIKNNFKPSIVEPRDLDDHITAAHDNQVKCQEIRSLFEKVGTVITDIDKLLPYGVLAMQLCAQNYVNTVYFETEKKLDWSDKSALYFNMFVDMRNYAKKIIGLVETDWSLKANCGYWNDEKALIAPSIKELTENTVEPLERLILDSLPCGSQPKECTFPFTYDGVSYSECVITSSGHPWCAFDAEFKSGQWMYCKNASCRGCYPSECKFPFEEGGKTYYQCTKEGIQAGYSWCAEPGYPADSDAWVTCGDCDLPPSN